MDLKISHRLSIPKRFDHFNNVNVVLKHDAVGSVFSFDVRFDVKDQAEAELFAVSHFHGNYICGVKIFVMQLCIAIQCL